MVKKAAKMVYKTSQKYDQIFKVGLNSTSLSKVLRKVRNVVLSRRRNRTQAHSFYITTPNPEIVLMAKDDRNLRDIINRSDFSLPDGIGLAATERFLSLSHPKNIILRAFVDLFEGLYVGFCVLFNREWLFEKLPIIKGRQLFLDLLKLANKKSWKVFLLGGNGAPAAAKQELGKSLKKVQIEAMDAPSFNLEGKTVSRRDIKREEEIIEKINSFKPDLLFVGMTPPKQEKWIARYVDALDTAVVMTVGGTFDYVGNKFPTPPKEMDNLGLEWLWRLVTQPNIRRIKRVLTAFPVFPLKVYWYKITKK